MTSRVTRAAIVARAQTITQANRRLDVRGALDYLRARPDIATKRVALLGWSHGGSATLAATNARQRTVAAYLEAQDDPNGVRPGQGVSVASNAAAREDAYARMKAQLRAALMP